MRGMDDLLIHLVFLAQNFNNLSKRHIVEIFLMEIGISTKKDSFNYIVESILLQESLGYSLVTKVVFPEVAKKHEMKTNALEKAIERAIQGAWKNRDEKWSMYLLDDGLVTNAEFVSRIARILGFWEDICKSGSKEEAQCQK